MQRQAGAVERFVCGSGGRVTVSKCRAVLGTAFAGGGGGVRLECGRAASVGLRARLAAQTERSGTAGDHNKMRFLCRHDAVTALLLIGCSATGGSRQQAKPAERRCPPAMPGNAPCCYKASEARRKPSPAVMHGAKAGQAGSNEPSGAMQSGMLSLCR